MFGKAGVEEIIQRKNNKTIYKKKKRLQKKDNTYTYIYVHKEEE